MPINNAQPFIGKKDEVSKVSEYYVETVCTPEVIHAVIAALKKAHPYEEPAYHVIRLEKL